jgi:methylated-DNA-protein-cysteine methyltransferase related protein
MDSLIYLDARVGCHDSARGVRTMSWDAVYRQVKKIPRGRVTTYGDLARALKLPGGARAVGYAMAACPRGLGVPWHRVVGASGKLLVSEPHAGLQQRLLETEGVAMRGRGVDMEQCAWSPVKKRAVRRKRTSDRSAKRNRKAR